MVVARLRCFLWILSWLLIGTASVRFCSGDVIISEFMADNTSTLFDGDGNASDWIELHNTSSSEVDLTGWYLTDDSANLQRWQFPSVSIPGGGFLIVFASGQEVDDYVDGLGYLHTNFKLSRNDNDEHESVVLVEPDGVTIAHGYLDYPEQSEDVSYGLSQEMKFTSLVIEGDDATALIPDGPVENWTDVGFDDGDWPLTGGTGVGYERETGYGGIINLDVDEMYGRNTSIYIRIEFEVWDPSVFDFLTLRMKYDDGFVAYLNGEWVASSPNAPGEPEWSSQATYGHEASITDYEDFDITDSIGALLSGKNVLAIHGLNVSLTSSDMVILPELVALDVTDVQESPAMFFTTPTPGAANATGVLGYVADTKFSVDRGFYSKRFDVTITTATEDAEIYYTLDGSTPTPETGILYTGPISVSKTTVLRAAAFKPGYQPSNVDTQTYIFVFDVVRQSSAAPGPGWPTGSVNGQVLRYGMNTQVTGDPRYAALIDDALLSIPSISLVTDLDNLFDPSIGIYVNAQQHGAYWERPVSVELIYPNGAEGPGFPDGADEGFQIDAGLRIRGGFSRAGSNPKHAFRLFFRSEYGDGKLNYRLFGDEGVDSFDKVDLRTAQNYSWSFQNDSANTMCRDVWARDTQGLTGQGYTRSRYYHLYINGQYWGIYETQERSEAAFGASYFGGDRDEYDTVKAAGPTGGYTTEVTDGTFDAWRALWDLGNRGFGSDTNYYHAQGLNPVTHQRDPKCDVLLDVDNLIDYMLVIFYDGDRDAPISSFLGDTRTNNWFSVRNRNGEEGFRFFVHDAEHILSRGATDRTGPYPCGDQFQYSNPQWLHQQLVANPEYRLRFADHVHKHLFNGGVLTADAAIERFLARAGQIDMAIIAESARWGNSSLTKSTWQNAVNNEVNNFFPSRAQVVINQFKSKGWYPAVEAPVFNQHGGSIAQGFLLSMSASGPVYYTLDGSDPRECGTGQAVGELYSGVFPLDMTTLVKARALVGRDGWSALNEALFVLDTPSPLRVTEVMYHPRDPSGPEADGNYTSEDFDFIELQNTGPDTIGLAGIKFTTGVVFDFTKGDVLTLAPGEYVVVVRNRAAFAIRYPDSANMHIAGEFEFLGGSLANNGERVTLIDGLGRTILSFEYDDDWCATTDGLGFSLVVLDAKAPPETWSRKAAWRPSTNVDGSPGADDPPPPEIPAVVVNEALTNSDPPAKDAIELYNPTAGRASIGGWYLTDDRTDPWKFRIPDGTEILPGDYLVFDEDDFNSDPTSPSSFLLSSLGEEVYLFSADAEGNLTAYSHGFRFGPAERGVTFGRWITSTGEEHFVAQTMPTLGTVNAGPKVGPVVINEIMYNPPSDGGVNDTKDEYVELRNISSQTVPLFDPDVPNNTWHIEGTVDYSFPTGVALPPYGYLLLISFDPEADRKATTIFRNTYGVDTSISILGPYNGTLGNSGGAIALFKPDAPLLPPDPDAGFVPYILVDRVDYSESSPWPAGASGTGESLQRVASSEYGNDPINWQVAAPTAGRDNPGAGVEDLDGDGLPDDWERAIVDFDPEDEIDDIGDVEGADDFDGDGASNHDEWLAGTDPTDASSVLAISSIVNGLDSTIIIRWRSVSGKQYSILRSTDLSMGFDQTEAANIPATPPENSYTIDGKEGKSAFYRIVLDE
jgi:hypothetical protein